MLVLIFFIFASGFSYPNFGVPAANGLSPAVRGGGGKMRRERTHFAASKPPEEEEVGLYT